MILFTLYLRFIFKTSTYEHILSLVIKAYERQGHHQQGNIYTHLFTLFYDYCILTQKNYMCKLLMWISRTEKTIQGI